MSICRAHAAREVTISCRNTMLMYGKEASNRKQEIDRQKISIVGKSKLLDFPTMPTTAESFPLLISLFPYTLNLYLVNAIMSLFKL